MLTIASSRLDRGLAKRMPKTLPSPNDFIKRQCPLSRNPFPSTIVQFSKLSLAKTGQASDEEKKEVYLESPRKLQSPFVETRNPHEVGLECIALWRC